MTADHRRPSQTAGNRDSRPADPKGHPWLCLGGFGETIGETRQTEGGRVVRSRPMSAPASRGLVWGEQAQACAVTDMLAPKVVEYAGPLGAGTRVLEIGCGRGFWASYFAQKGCTVVGIDPSPTGIQNARSARPGIRFEQMEASPSLLTDLGESPFDIVLSTEVVEHTYDPYAWAAAAFNALRPGGKLVLSTPYHGWLKNVIIALAGKSDFHHDTLRVGGHIKFFSNRQLTGLLRDAGFTDLRCAGVGRVAYLWMSVVVSATRP